MTERTSVLLKQKEQGNLTGTIDLKKEKKIPFPYINSGSISYFQVVTQAFVADKVSSPFPLPSY